MPKSTIVEAKVALPVAVTTVSAAVSGAVFKLLLAYDLIDPTDDQELALLGLGAALLFVANTVTAYVAPHTKRPDLP